MHTYTHTLCRNPNQRTIFSYNLETFTHWPGFLKLANKEPLPYECIKPSIINIAFHRPCALQHGQKLDGTVENILKRAALN